MAHRFSDFVRRRRQFWTSVPPRGHALVLGAAFLLFTGVGFLTDIIAFGQRSIPIAFAAASVSGGIVVGLALALMRSARFLAAVAALYLVLIWLNSAYGVVGLPIDAAALAAFPARVRVEATAAVVTVTTAYALFIVFIAGEGRRYLRAHTEVALAQEIHRHLVPAIDRTIGRFEFFGASLPSSEVGGDLVDVVDGTGEGRWVAYVADVSGHGVASGALMGMFKSAVRTRLSGGASLETVLGDVNRVLVDLRKPGMFVTCAFIAAGRDDERSPLRFAVAGHPPILHRRQATGVVDELSVSQPPVAMLDREWAFRSKDVHVDRGDVLALVSDGLMEVFDPHDREYGLDAIKRTLAASATRPLRDVFDAIVADVRRHGPQLDDQSLLLVRVKD